MTEEDTPPLAPAPEGAVAVSDKPAGSRRPVIIVGLIVAFLALVLFLVRNNVSADDLKVDGEPHGL